jgi:hypothetical protein
MALRSDAPLHVREGLVTEWAPWFAWRPVRSEQGRWIWCRRTWRRRFRPPAWFVPPAPGNGWAEYSDERRGYWEHPVLTFSTEKTPER